MKGHLLYLYPKQEATQQSSVRYDILARNNDFTINNHFDTDMLNMNPLASTDIICTSTWDFGCGFRPFVVQILYLINEKVERENTRRISNIKRASCFMICR